MNNIPKPFPDLNPDHWRADIQQTVPKIIPGQALVCFDGFYLKKPGPGSDIPSDIDVIETILADELEDEKHSGHYLLCSYCRSIITHEKSAYSVNGSIEHSCLNPAGIHFHIQCFSQAGGCHYWGEPTWADSWFPGYRWQIAACGCCDRHLGWFFSGSPPPFYGLIMRNLLLSAR